MPTTDTYYNTNTLFGLISGLSEIAPTVARGLEERVLKLAESERQGFWKAGEALQKMEVELQALTGTSVA
jgi:hypothetical protein